ncbi:MAG: tRNA 2-thiouridine(34) synthase MnmA [Betaproteobacteria bacterium]|nr:tRNA 2-thiouridine(34) synthase MnmA [Betaproteobacteria bacterium]
MTSQHPQPGESIVVGMSGGVDSSVAALLLKRAGAAVRGLFMRCWEDQSGDCPAGADAVAAAAAADAIGIELDVVDLVGDYRREVFAGFLDELRAGRTPNPDVWCNANIKFASFARIAAARYGATRIATGHYARIDGVRQRLLKAEAEGKDQTYFLYRLDRNQLAQSLFPLGDLPTKAQVRSIAREAGLPTAERRESMGICFIGKRPFREFVSEHIRPQSGAIVDEHGRQIGTHDGVHLYTIGQRGGLGLGGEGPPWYVAGKDCATNTITAVRGRNHRLLYCRRVRLRQTSWVAGRPPPCNWVYTCRFRHRMEPAPCTLEQAGAETATVAFADEQAAVAPGQALVVYDGIDCLGGGTIETTDLAARPAGRG